MKLKDQNLGTPISKSTRFLKPLRPLIGKFVVLFVNLFVARELCSQELYIIDNGNSRLYQADKNVPGQSGILRSSLPSPYGIAVDPDSGDIYYTDGSNNPTGGRVIRVNKDGTNPTIVASGLNRPQGIALDSVNNVLYFVQNVATVPAIFSVSITGTPAPALLVSGVSGSGPIDVDVHPATGTIFWTDARGASIRKATISGASQETLVDNISAPLSGIAVDSTNDRVFWINDATSQIQYIEVGDLAPASPLTAITDDAIAQGGLAVDGTQSPTEFFIAKNSSQVLKATLDGTVQELLGISDGVAQPTDVGVFNVALPTPTPTTPIIPTATPTPESPILSPSTELTRPPEVSVARRSVTLILRNFSSAISIAQLGYLPNLSESQEYEFQALAAKKVPKLVIRYDVKVTASKKKDSKRLLSKRNQLTLKNLKPGNYSANYSAIAFQKKSAAQIQKAKSNGKTDFNATHKKVFSTKFSPSAGFTIAK